MAKQIWNNPIDKTIDWGGDSSTGGAPVSGEMVQRFIKESFEKKAGEFYYDNTNNRYLVFADEETRNIYLQDPTQTNLILGTFDAPFNYNAEITLHSKAYNAVFLNSTGNYIEFDFDIKNKQGASTGENVNITYTFIRNATRQTFTEIRKFGDSVRLNIDKYLGEGTNTITIGVTGQTSLAATTVAITYQVVNLTLEDSMDISKVYDLRKENQILEVPFVVSGYGTKIVEWYIDGELLPFVKAEDEVVDVITERTKYITLSNLQQGSHSLQMRAYSLVNGEKFYTDVLYRNFLVYTGISSNVIMGIATTIPGVYGILGTEDNVAIYDMVQYIPYILRFATYSPTNAASTEVSIYLDTEFKGSVNSVNGVENKFIITPKTSGNKNLSISAESTVKELAVVVKKTDMSIDEIDSGLILDFNTEGKTNNSEYKDVWSYGEYIGTFSGFNWNNSSGWVNGRLEINAGASFGINISPLIGNPTLSGKTIEIEWSSKNVTNDDAIICDLRGDDGVGILITATKVSMISKDGVVIETEYKSDENIRIGFVVNKATGSINKRLSFIYANGVISRAEQWAENDDYSSSKELMFTATNEAQISLKAIRIYNTALSSDNMLNNYILYRDSIEEMLEVYDRNDIYEEGTTTFSPEKMMSRLPVMIVTGDIPTLENTSSKDTQIVVDIEYYNTQDPSRSFTMKNAAMRPQGTSSMGYPKKNFRIYTQKVAETILYDAEGKEVLDKLYAFKEGSQPVDCWCLKADYAESSGTHNTGIARLWNNALYNVQIDGEYKLRTNAQRIAAENKYPYDVRTTIDGFPILMFYRKNPTDDLIFIGKYNFNNDKSTESVFGFTGIPGFNNERMQCWEILNNGNALALFTTTENFDTAWKDAFESRYPDTKTPYLGDLKAFSEWMVSVNQEDFTTQKWEHLDIYKMAAYWCYLMRHAAADQFVKNAMFTSEDGQHFYFILYDNDTINGLINTGYLRLKPTDGRQTVDATGSYVFAGHDSRLWNMLEADQEFMTIVSEVDNALYSAGISYENTIRIFDEEQAEKWVEKVYNQDAQYKYIGPFVEKGIDNLFMLQGRRDLHRRWWLAKRFSIYDAKHVSGSYKSQAVEIKCINGTPAGQKFSIKAGYPLDYGYGINDVPREFGISLDVGDYKQFTTKEVINLGDPVRIYAAPNIAEIDFSLMSDKLAVVNMANIYNEALGTKLTKFVLGNAQKQNIEVSEISGLKQAKNLEYLDIQGMLGLTSIDLSEHKYLKTLKAFGSGISSVSFTKGAPIERLELPASLRILYLEQLSYLKAEDVVLENVLNLSSVNVKACPNITNDFNFVYNWYINKITTDSQCSLVMDNVDWHLADADKFMEVLGLKTNGGTFSIKGRIKMDSIKVEQIYAIEDILGESSFDSNAEFYVDIPSVLQINSDDSVLEGNDLQFTTSIYPYLDGQYTWSIESGRVGCSINQNGLLTTEETALDTSDVVVKVTFVATDGDVLTAIKTVSVVRRTYPQDAVIIGNINPLEKPYTYIWETTTEGVNGEFYAEWILSGDVTSVVEIASYDNESCTMRMLDAVTELVDGLLTLNIRKSYDGTLVVNATKELQAMLEGVIITRATNGVLQSILYSNGLVANENYSLIEEIEKITAEQLQTGTSSSTSIFYQSYISSFEEFQYFTGLTHVPDYLFSSIQNLKKIILPNTIKSIGGYAFNKVSIENINIPEGVTQIGTYAFDDCESLKNIHLPDSLLTIESYCFSHCISLEQINIPNNVTEIKDSAFYACTNLLEVTIGSNVKSIDKMAFSYCKSLKKIVCLPILAPSLEYSPFASGNPFYTDSFTGRNTYSTGENVIHITPNATGYEEGYWLHPLQDADKCGFTIYGKLIINTNKPLAKFSITYTTVDGDTKTINVDTGVSYLNDIQYDTNVTIRVISGGIPEEGAEKTFVYNNNNNTHTFTFSKEGSWITIDQTIVDSDTMISGDINGEHIQSIRNNSHRYLGKYTANGQMTICQLADSNSNIYANGESAILSGEEGDVFVKLPRFWYASIEKESNIWEIGFYYGNDAPTESYWKEWDGNDLLGAFPHPKPSDKKIKSIAGIQILAQSSSALLSYNDCITFVNNRGEGFSEMSFKWYNILSLLFYAQYGTTSFYKKFVTETSSYTTGKTSNTGMNDVGNSEFNSLWGVEGLVRSFATNFIGNVFIDYVSPNHIWKITEEDGTVRNVTGSGAYSGYVMKMSFGDNADLIPIEIDKDGYGSDTTGFGTMLSRAASSNRVLSISLGYQILANKPNNNSYALGRISFMGTVIEETSPSIFKSLTTIG